jgi:modulator of FtsH protease HflK
MPWNNQPGSSNGDGQGPRGPWSRGPSGGGTPDINDLLRRSQERLRQLIPEGGLSRGTLLAIGLGLFVLWLLSGVYFVTSHEQGFVMRFGRVVAHSAQGINYHLPWPFETAQVVEVTSINELDIGSQPGSDASERGQTIDVPAESLMLTRDGNIIDVNFKVSWVVRDASAYLFNIDNPDKTIKAVAESAMREVIGRTNYDSIDPNRESVEGRVREIMQKTLDLYGSGVAVTEVHLGTASAPDQVNKAALEVEAARTGQDSARDDAEAYANKIILDARGQASSIVQQAEAYRQKAIAEASGQAKRFLAIYEQYRKAPEVTRRRIYLETMSQILGSLNKVILDDQGGHGAVPYFALPDLQKNRPNETVTVTPQPAPPQLTQGPQP